MITVLILELKMSTDTGVQNSFEWVFPNTSHMYMYLFVYVICFLKIIYYYYRVVFWTKLFHLQQDSNPEALTSANTSRLV